MEPDHVKALYTRGACYNIKGLFSLAIDDYTKALEKDAGDSGSLRKEDQPVCIGEPSNQDNLDLHPSAAQDDTSANRHQKALSSSAITIAIEDDHVPVDSSPSEIQLNEYVEEDLWTRIEQNTRKLIQNPNDVTLRCCRAYLFSQVGELHAAIRDYTQALIRSPDVASVYYNRGILHDELTYWDAAVRDYTTAIAIDPSNPDFHNNRGFTFRKQGRLDAALEDYAKALSLQPDHPEALMNSRIVASVRKTFTPL